MTQPIIYPLIVMAFLTIIVASVMYRRRVSYMKKNRIHPQKVQNRSDMLQQMSDTRASDNYLNLFEAPVLFYVAVFTMLLTNTHSHLLVALAWAFVIFRVAHSFIHCTYNKVMHRFTAFILSCLVLFAMWVVIALNIIFQIKI
ncbi:MAG: MAPEG family protein [Kangiellaceae bacterium]|nr:MAPEG family protein [Kangiellaceae bacterium]